MEALYYAILKIVRRAEPMSARQLTNAINKGHTYLHRQDVHNSAELLRDLTDSGHLSRLYTRRRFRYSLTIKGKNALRRRKSPTTDS